MSQKSPFILAFDNKEDSLTSHAGLPLICELWKKLKLKNKIKNYLQLKSKGISENNILKTLVSLVTIGGDSIDDVIKLKMDKAFLKLAKIEKISSPNTLLRFLKLFHQDFERSDDIKSFVPDESKALGNLGFLFRRVASQIIERSKIKEVTIENDATYVESHKQNCLKGYKGKGYMPVIGVIPELDIIIHDQFRDGNVSAFEDVTGFFKNCLKALPDTVKKIKTRLDGAYYNHDFMKYLDKQKIMFTITAKKSSSLLDAVKNLKEEMWQPLKDKDGIDTERDFTTLYWTSAEGTREDMKSRSRLYLITRKRRVQSDFEFEQMTAEEKQEKLAERYEAIVTNNEVTPADNLIRWHYGRGGHIEKVHDRIKNDLGAGTMPCAEFGANAAWFRINCLAWNLIRILQLEVLPEGYRSCYLKKLRLWLFNVAGRVIETGHQIILKLSGCRETFEIYRQAREKIAALEVPG